MKRIKDMPEHTRPREKLREKGASALTDLVEANRELIGRFEKKLQAKLAEIWGEEGQAQSSPERIKAVQENMR